MSLALPGAGSNPSAPPSPAASPSEDVKTHLIEKLIEENRLLLAELQHVQDHGKTETLRLKRDAAQIMDRLVQDNAIYRRELLDLQRRFDGAETLEKKARETLLVWRQEKEAITRDREALMTQVMALREQKTHLDYELKHLGAAFLTLREAVCDYIGNPVALEAASTEVSWASRADSPRFRAAVTETVQETAKLRTVLEAIDARLVSLKLLDPTASVAVKKTKKSQQPGLHLMGEKLVPLHDLTQAKKERQLWQRRYMKSQEEIALFRVKEEQLTKDVENKEALIKKLQAQKSVGKTTEASRSSLRSQIQQLQHELERTKQKYREAQTLLETARSAAPHETAQHVLTPAQSRAFLGPGSPSTVKIAPSRTLQSPPKHLPSLSPQPQRRSPSSFARVRTASPGSLTVQRTLSPPRSPSMRTVPIPEPTAPVSRQATSFTLPTKPVPSKRLTIGTTVSTSEFQTALAREVAGLQKAETPQRTPTLSNTTLSWQQEPEPTTTPPASQMTSDFLVGRPTSTVAAGGSESAGSALHQHRLTPAASAMFLDGTSTETTTPPSPRLPSRLQPPSDFLGGFPSRRSASSIHRPTVTLGSPTPLPPARQGGVTAESAAPLTLSKKSSTPKQLPIRVMKVATPLPTVAPPMDTQHAMASASSQHYPRKSSTPPVASSPLISEPQTSISPSEGPSMSPIPSPTPLMSPSLAPKRHLSLSSPTPTPPPPPSEPLQTPVVTELPPGHQPQNDETTSEQLAARGSSENAVSAKVAKLLARKDAGRSGSINADDLDDVLQAMES